jgi:hypothetical protein
MNHLARQELAFSRQFGLDEIEAGIEAVTWGDVCRIARDLFAGPVAASVLGDLRGWRPRARDLRV